MENILIPFMDLLIPLLFQIEAVAEGQWLLSIIMKHNEHEERDVVGENDGRKRTS